MAGIRAGVDGTYTISRVVHRLSRASGFITTLTLTQPGGDSR